MGSVVSDIVADPKTDDVSDFVDTSMALLETKSQLYLSQLCESGKCDHKISISKILHEEVEFRCGITKDSKIGEEATKVIGKFADEKYAQAIGSIIGTATTILLGESSGSVSEKTKYLIFCGKSGAIMRMDYTLYIKKVQAKRLKEVSENFFMVIYVISSVKTEGLGWNDLASIVELSYGGLDYEQVVKPLIELLEKKHMTKGPEGQKLMMF